MFNGIIKKTGTINIISKKGKNCKLILSSKTNFSKKDIGSSISCSGACLTLENVKKNLNKFYLSKETLNRTNFKYANKGDIINIEKSVKYGDRISGHFVLGHVDSTAVIKKINFVGKSWSVSFKTPQKYKKYLIYKGSITINGVSFTIAKLTNEGFNIVVIPQTLKLTNLFFATKNDFVNVEFDILGKYIINNTK